MNDNIEYEIRPKDKLSLGLKELWEYRELFYFFTWRDIKVKYKQAALGIIWAILQPLLLMLIFTAIFNKGLNIQSEGVPYPVFVFSGLIIWQIFSGGLGNAANSMVSNAQIIRKIYFPRLILPLSSILTALFDFCFAWIIFIGLLVYYRVNIHPGIWLFYLTFSLFFTLLATSGLSLLLSAMNVKYRDFQYAIPFLIQLLFFMSPVLYDTNHFKDSLFNTLLKMNPMSGAIHLARVSFNGHAINWELLCWSGLSSILILVAGLITFRNMESYFADLA